MVREGTALGSYVIEGYIASGGMGVVYRAQHRVLRRTVAIKVLQEAFARSPSIRQRFEQEAMVQANLIHPNIVPVTDFVSADGLVALVMEFVAGPSLDQVLEEELPGPWAESTWLPMFARVVSGVAYAHAAGVVHRDLKPGNVLLDRAAGRPGIPRITDFGIAKLVSGSAPAATRAGSRLGTVPFMAPEQFRGELDVGPAADVFALGMLAWRMATGSLPVNPDDMLAAAELYTGRRTIPSFAAAAPWMSTELAEALDACLSLDPGRRPRNAGVLLGILGRPSLGTVSDPREVRGHASRGDSGPADNTSPEPSAAVPADDAIARAGERAAAANGPEVARSRRRLVAFVAIGSIAILCMILGVVWMGKRLSTPMTAEELKNEAQAAAAAQPADPEALCNKAFNNVVAILKADADRAPMAAMLDTPEMRKEAIEVCKKDDPKKVQCLIDAKTYAEFDACDKKAGAENAAGAALKEAEKAAEEAGKAAVGTAPPAAAPARDMDVLCNKALDHIISLLDKDPSVPPEAKTMMKTQASDPAKRADSISKCKQDKPETVECMLRTSDMAGMMACQAEK